MQRARAHLRIEQRHFDPVAIYPAGTLRVFAVPEDLIGAILERVGPLASLIVNTPSSADAAAN